MNEIAIIESCGNVFLDLGFSPAEAAEMKLHAEAMLKMEQQLRTQSLTQTEVTRRLQQRPA